MIILCVNGDIGESIDNDPDPIDQVNHFFALRNPAPWPITILRCWGLNSSIQQLASVFSSEEALAFFLRAFL
jgi:hypothetical protein